jgi:hypothetical protein
LQSTLTSHGWCSCRFLSPPPVTPPAAVKVNFADYPHNYVYNATCIAAIRAALVEAYSQPMTGVTRPASASTGPPSTQLDWRYNLWDAASKALLFLKAQWAGALPASYVLSVPWRDSGFVDACVGRADGGSFATGGAILRLAAALLRLVCVASLEVAGSRASRSLRRPWL